jgi:hypothetical protein
VQIAGDELAGRHQRRHPQGHREHHPGRPVRRGRAGDERLRPRRPPARSTGSEQ